VASGEEPLAAAGSGQGSLQRLIGVRALALTAMNTTVGAGIFGLPALVAADMGASAPIGYIVTALLFFCVVLCFAEAGSRVSSAGGLYAYSSAAFGPFAGSFVGPLLWFGNGALSNAAVAVLMVNGLALAFPALGEPLGRNLTLIVVYASLAAINIRGLKPGLRVTEGITVIKLLPLVLLAVVGLATLNWSQIALPSLPDSGQLGRGIVLLTFAFMGIETSLSPSAEIRDPTRVVPRGLAIALLGITALYFSLQLVAQGTLGDGLAGATGAPLAATASIVLGGWGRVLILGAGVACMAGVLPGDLMCTPRVLYAMGRDGLLPARLGVVHPRFNTPAAAIVTYCLVCAALALSGTFKSLAVLAAASTLVMYLFTAIAVLVLRRRGVNLGQPAFVIPGGPVVPVIAAVAIIAVLSTLAWRELAAIGVMLAVSSVPFFWRTVNRTTEVVP
jgi:amino acid transporter